MKSFLLSITFLFSIVSIGQNKLPSKEIDQTRLIKEITFSKMENGDITILYWFPINYFEVASAKDPKQITPEMVSIFQEILGNKTMVLGVTGKMNPTSNQFEAKDEKYIRSNISITQNGKTYKPISAEKLSDELNMLSGHIKPMFEQMLGALGAGICVFYFDITDNAGENILTPFSDLDFTLGIGANKGIYHLPLSCFYKDSKCSNDGETFPANYEFCPYHGSKLISQ
ncbi:hypothetical protein [Fluviicola taffensis]|uniref:Uncharacterized protein n=1 Tax=Fluviicola taffensis (strain DSM 16823 / NCIMB 13979 / RW262) TaxID=755732 RepID=F2IHV6_FLUTR|nr:hypothetical protein [Fluviicola taffensis]AEA45915.1 hypothetical protein Fluta_3951 [Fluviicola taffensis DSM 16823]